MTQLTNIAANIRGMAQALDSFASLATVEDVFDLWDELREDVKESFVARLADRDELPDQNPEQVVERYAEDFGTNDLLDAAGLTFDDMVAWVADYDVDSVLDELRSRGDLPEEVDGDELAEIAEHLAAHSSKLDELARKVRGY